MGLSRQGQFGAGETGRELAEDLQQPAEDRTKQQYDHHREQHQGRDHTDQGQHEPKNLHRAQPAPSQRRLPSAWEQPAQQLGEEQG